MKSESGVLNFLTPDPESKLEFHCIPGWHWLAIKNYQSFETVRL